MLLTLALLIASPPQPGLFPTRAGQCQWVRGRFNMANGSSINRLWVRGTGHLLALRDDDQAVPPAIERYWREQNPFEYSLWGEFYVCARKRYIPGHMQHIRILRTRRTVVTAR